MLKTDVYKYNQSLKYMNKRIDEYDNESKHF